MSPQTLYDFNSFDESKPLFTIEDIREIKGRLGILENQYAHMSNRIDRLDARVERIEQRLELTEV